MDDVGSDSVGFRPLVESQAASSAPLVSIGQRAIVPVEHHQRHYCRCVCEPEPPTLQPINSQLAHLVERERERERLTLKL